uniref:Beta-fructofuranosidase, insoluble isoenzyme IVR1.2_3B n=1 Tax=Triticum aestivum TaxID=4565 RepID=M5FHF6_WHEAT|nr:beta-fructofuranosidase, insoluble isoenzyme IVR1.2_3B [Triticum aestivum]
MGTAAAVLAIVSLLCCAVVQASHVVYPELQSLEAKEVATELRTGYHFQPPKHWINGPMYYKGLYHLFYQYNPKGAVWGNIIWAHSFLKKKKKLAALRLHRPHPLGGPGARDLPHQALRRQRLLVRLHHHVANISYPANISDPFLREWVKPEYNPIITPDHGINASAFQDPTTAWYGPDGHKWVKAHHSLHAGMTGMWECPDFYPVAVAGGNHHHQSGVDTTELHDRVVAEEVKYVLKDNDYGLRYDYGDFYASKSFDPAKNAECFGAGPMSLTPLPTTATRAGPASRKIFLSRSGRQLIQWPVEEVKSLRSWHVNVSNKAVKGGEYFEVTGFKSVQSDVEAAFTIRNLDKADKFDLAWSSYESQIYRPTFAGFVNIDIAKTKKIALRTLIDHSVVESFGAGRKTCILARIYPRKAIGEDAHLFVFNNGESDIKVTNLDAWHMKTPTMNKLLEQ